MRLNELIRIIARENPEAVPGILTRHFPFVRAHMLELMEQLQRQNDLTGSIRVAMLWIMALSVTQGAIETGASDHTELTPFGIDLLNRVVEDTLGLNNQGIAPLRHAEPTEEELQRLDFELWGQATSDNPRNLHALLLARLTRVAIALAPAMLTAARQTLAATALLLVELLKTVVEPSEKELFDEEVHSLLASAASCIPADDFEWARHRAITTYHQLQQHDAVFNQHASSSTDIEKLVAELINHPPSAIPRLLVAKLPVVCSAPQAFAQELLPYAQPRSPQVAAALLCLKLILQGSYEPTIFPFGVILLTQLSLEETDVTTFLPAAPDPTEAELQQVDAVLWSEIETDHMTRDQGLLLGQLTRIALNRAPARFAREREELAVTAVRLAMQLYTIAEQHGGDDVLDAAITLFMSTTECFPTDSQRWAESRVHCGRAFEKRYDWHGNTTDLDRAIDCYSKASGGLAVGSVEWYGAKMLEAHGLRQRHETLNDSADLDAVLQCYAEVASFLPDESDYAQHHINWANTLYTRYEITRNLNDLNHTIEHCASAAVLLTPPSLDWADAHMLWGLALTERYRVVGSLNDLDEAITRYKGAAPCYPIGSQDGAGCYMNWGSALSERYEARTNLADLEQAMEQYARATAIFPRDSPNWARCQMNWANALHKRFRISTSLADLDNALTRYKHVAPLLIENRGEWAMCQMNWANTLVDRYRVRRERADLDQAIDRYGHAVKVYQGLEHQAAQRSLRFSPVNRANCQVNWGHAYATRYEAFGDADDLDAAITCYTDAAEVLLPDSLDMAACDQAWGNALFLRHRALENSSDLDQALERYTRALKIFPVGSIDWAQCQMSLANVFQARYDLHRHPADLTEAINYYTRGAGLFPAGSFDEAQRLAGLANSLLERYHQRADIGDLHTAITAVAEAAAMFPEQSLDKARCFVNWGIAILYRCVARQGASEDLDSALLQFERALEIFPASSLRRASCQMHAGLVLRTRYELTGSQDDLEEAVHRYQEATHIFTHTGMLADYQRAQVGLARCYLLASNNLSAYKLLAEAINLLEHRVLGLPTQRDQLRMLDRGGDVYQSIVKACLGLAGAADGNERQRWLREAWHYVERSRARLTIQTIVQAALAAPSTSGDDLQLALRNWGCIEREIASLYELLSQRANHGTSGSGLSPASLQRIRALESEFGSLPARIQSLETQLVQAREKLREYVPELDTPGRTQAFDIDTVQYHLRIIPDGALLVEFFAMPEALVMFLLDGKVLRVEQAAITADDLRQRTHAFRRPHTRVPPEQALDDALTQLGEQLACLLAPHLAELPTPAPDMLDHVPHLLLLPTADLHVWPLHALPLGDGTRLIDHYAISLLPSAAVLPILANQKALPGPYYGFVPPVSHLPHVLPQMYAEAAILGAAVTQGAILKQGAEATFDALRTVSGGILSFATHAEVDLAAPERSAIQLGARNGSIEALEWVTALEFLVGLDQLHCQLLLLWACRTHGEGAQAGDNWLGISRAFLRAGRTLVSSLWLVEDEVTLAISLEFVRGLTSGLTVPQALRRATRIIQLADVPQLEEWEHAIMQVLPDEQARDTFRVTWETRVKMNRRRIAARLGLSRKSPFATLQAWAPYVTIGWPALIHKEEGAQRLGDVA